MKDLIWNARAFWEGLNLAERVVAALNLAWAGLWLFIILRTLASGDNGEQEWGLLLGGIVWFWGQAALAFIGLLVVWLFGSRSRSTR